MQFKIVIYFKAKLFFSTGLDSLLTVGELVNVFNILNRKFPEEEGYILDVCISVMTFSRAAFLQLASNSSQVIFIIS